MIFSYETEMAYGDAVGERLVPVPYHPSQLSHPLEVSEGIRKGTPSN